MKNEITTFGNRTLKNQLRVVAHFQIWLVLVQKLVIRLAAPRKTADRLAWSYLEVGKGKKNELGQGYLIPPFVQRVCP